MLLFFFARSTASEDNCAQIQGETFQCKDGRCIYLSWKCDGKIDCQPDGEDELNCRGDYAYMSFFSIFRKGCLDIV